MNPQTHRVIFNKSRGCILETSELKNPVKTAAITTEIDKWAEGGGYRVALHSLTGALSGGISGALGAAASASAAPLLQQLSGTPRVKSCNTHPGGQVLQYDTLLAVAE